jgi:hypothetical protein
MPQTPSSASKFEVLTTAPVEKLVLHMAVPTIITMMISALYNMADTYFVSFLGTRATAAVGVSFSFMAIIQAIGFFFGHGSGNYISRALGAQKNADAQGLAAGKPAVLHNADIRNFAVRRRKQNLFVFYNIPRGVTKERKGPDKDKAQSDLHGQHPAGGGEYAHRGYHQGQNQGGKKRNLGQAVFCERYSHANSVSKAPPRDK